MVEGEIAGLASLPIKVLQTAWHRLHGAEPPTRLSRDLLSRGIAYKLQERAYGGLSPETTRRLRSLLAAPGKERRAHSPAPQLKPGTRLVREWHGHIHNVIVLENGFDYEAGHYRSLSEIARRITSSHRSGPLFFGLKSRPASITAKTGHE